MNLKAYGKYVIFEMPVLDQHTTTAGGIITLQDNRKHLPVKCLSAGKEVSQIKEGDTILVTVGQGQHVRQMGTDYIFLTEEDVLAVVET